MFYICFALLSIMLACPLYTILHIMLFGIHLENWNCSMETEQTAQYFVILSMCNVWCVFRGDALLVSLFCRLVHFHLAFSLPIVLLLLLLRHHRFPNEIVLMITSFPSFFDSLLILRSSDHLHWTIRWQSILH